MPEDIKHTPTYVDLNFRSPASNFTELPDGIQIAPQIVTDKPRFQANRTNIDLGNFHHRHANLFLRALGPLRLPVSAP